MKRVKLVVAYEGTKYAGWQIQKNALSVEEVLNRTLSELTGEEIHVIGASRTDAGVHALGNVAVFDTGSRIPAEKFSYALNERLPDDIRIQGSEEVPANFHPRYAPGVKTYEYRILNQRFAVPSMRHNTYFYHRPLDVEAMQKAAECLVGEHDFASFCSVHAQVKETVRTIFSVDIRQEETLICIRISGNGFLYNMVRIIAGTLIEVGAHKLMPAEMKRILDARDREQAGPCAPAVGLTLLGIQYEEKPVKQLLISNEHMFYAFVQQDIAQKKRAYLIIYWCCGEELAALIARMTKKAFRMGANKIYVRHDGGVELCEMLAPSKNNRYQGKEFFTAGNYRYVKDHEVVQMDRDLRANPSGFPQSGVGDALAQTDFVRLNQENAGIFLEIYNQCFYSLEGALTYDEEDIKSLLKAKDRSGYLLTDRSTPVGVCIAGPGRQDEFALEVHALAIIGKYRRRGYAKAALEEIAHMAEEQQKKRVTLHVADKNTKAVSLYLQSGFYRIRTTHKWYAADAGRRSSEADFPEKQSRGENCGRLRESFPA